MDALSIELLTLGIDVQAIDGTVAIEVVVPYVQGSTMIYAYLNNHWILILLEIRFVGLDEVQ